MKTEEEKIIKDFLKEVKEKLPSWLRDKRKETRDVLGEIEDHIWDKAEVLGNGAPTVATVRQAIQEMGAPVDIAREFKRRGTPKVWISEELWPLYLKALKVLVAIIIGVNIALAIFNGIINGWLSGLTQLSDIWVGLLGAFTLVTIIFVALSMEGYLPEDLGQKKEKGEPGKPQVEDRKHKFVKVGDSMAGGIIGIVGGFVLIGLRTILGNTPNTVAIPPGFFSWLAVVGILSVVSGVLDLSRALVGNAPSAGPAHSALRGIAAVMSFIGAGLLVFLLLHPEIVPWYQVSDVTSEIVLIPLPTEYYATFRGIVGLFIAGSIIDGIVKIYKAITLKP